MERPSYTGWSFFYLGFMERYLSLIVLLVLVNYGYTQDLNELRWKQRVILLFGDVETNGFLEQERLLKNAGEAMEERDLVLWRATDQTRRELQLDTNFTGIVLIGKDGGIKLKKAFTVPLETLWQLIDGMPMRKAELLKQKH